MRTRSSKKSTRRSWIEPLESRLLLANIHVVDAYFTDADGNKLTSVAVGNQPFIQVEFTTANLSAAAHYDVTVSNSGRTFTNTLNWGAGLASGSWVYRIHSKYFFRISFFVGVKVVFRHAFATFLMTSACVG